MSNSLEKRLEAYTLKHPQEVLIVTVEGGGEEDCILIFKGFSSSLMRPTAFDPDAPVFPPDARIVAIDRAVSPFNPDSPRYLQRDLTWEEMEPLLD